VFDQQTTMRRAVVRIQYDCVFTDPKVLSPEMCVGLTKPSATPDKRPIKAVHAPDRLTEKVRDGELKESSTEDCQPDIATD
jgi:hypothetical protein